MSTEDCLTNRLFGCAIGQAILYYTWYQSDSSVTKLMGPNQGYLRILDSVRNIWGSQNHGDLFNFLIVSHSGAQLYQLTEAIMIVLVQWFFVRAIWPSLVYNLWSRDLLVGAIQDNEIVIFIAICTSIAADLYIAVSLCLVLHGARTGFRSVIAMIFYLPVGSIYANSLLAALNIRKRVSEAGAAAHNSVVVPNINTDHLGLQNHQESDELHGLPDSQPTADIELADNAESAAQWRLA
ncbi:predicted protein [Postia placenta Mad-698-R]|nr:predicted protein [Postia placenta Mad-698-R]